MADSVRNKKVEQSHYRSLGEECHSFLDWAPNSQRERHAGLRLP